MQHRNATLADLPLIVEIYNSTIESRMVTADTEPVTVADKLEWFNRHSDLRPVWMLEEKGQIVGWVSFNDFYGRPAYKGTAEVSIYLKETERGKGYGKQALQLAISQAGNLKLHTLLGFIFSHNTPSIKLFISEGFETWGEMKDIAVMDDRSFSLQILGKKITSWQ